MALHKNIHNEYILSINDQVTRLIRKNIEQDKINIYDCNKNLAYRYSLFELLAVCEYVRANIHFTENTMKNGFLLPYESEAINNFFKVYLLEKVDLNELADFIIIADYLIMEKNLFESICRFQFGTPTDINKVALFHYKLENTFGQSVYDKYIYQLCKSILEITTRKYITDLDHMQCESNVFYLTYNMMHQLLDHYHGVIYLKKSGILPNHTTIINLNQIYLFYYNHIDLLTDELFNYLLDTTIWKYIYASNILIIKNILMDKNINIETKLNNNLVGSNDQLIFTFRIRENSSIKFPNMRNHYNFYHDLNICGMSCYFLGEVELNPRLEYVNICLNKNFTLSNYFDIFFENNIEKIIYTMLVEIPEINYSKTHEIIIERQGNNRYVYIKNKYASGHKFKNDVSIINLSIKFNLVDVIKF